MRYFPYWEVVTAIATVRNPYPKTLDYRVMVALCPTRTNIIAATSNEIPVTAAAGESKTITIGLSPPASGGLYDSYLLGVYHAADGTWKVAMANYAFEGAFVCLLTTIGLMAIIGSPKCYYRYGSISWTDITGDGAGFTYKGLHTDFRLPKLPIPQVPLGSTFQLMLQWQNTGSIVPDSLSIPILKLIGPDRTVSNISPYSTGATSAQFQWNINKVGAYFVQATLVAKYGGLNFEPAYFYGDVVIGV